MSTKGDNEKFCSECGEVINIKAEICPKCGVRQLSVPQPAPTPSSSNSNKTTAGILGLLLGGIGAHKFYLGKSIQGLLYLVFCWTFIPAIIGFIEGLNYLTMSQQVFDSRFPAK